MRSTCYFILGCCVIFTSCKEKEVDVYAAAEIFELAAPKIEVDSLLFNTSAEVAAVFNLEGADIRYTIDGGDVTSDARLYQSPLTVNEPTEFSFRAFHPDYLPSKVVRMRLLKVKKEMSTAQISLTPQADSNYRGHGAKGLVDLQKGTTQFRAGNSWMGFQGEQIRIVLDFENQTSISKLIVSSLNDHGSWVFLPKSIRVFTDRKEKIGSISIPLPTAVEPKSISLLDVPVIAGSYKSIEVHIDLLETIPQWHQGKGTAPFFFIDEILVE
jgi:hypothetical protein